MSDISTARRFWEGRVSALCRQIAVAAWLSRLLPALFFTISAFAIACYALRRLRAPLDLLAPALMASVALVAFVTWWRARRAFFQPAEARVLLESELGLDSRLTVAAENLTPWPSVPATVPRVVRWRLAPSVGWLAAMIVLFAAALVLPVPMPAENTSQGGRSPALVQTEELLNALKKMEIADPAAVRAMEQQVAELGRRPAEQQFSHSALEAADALKNQATAAAAELARELDAAARAMQAGVDDRNLNSAGQRMESALAGLRDGALPANQDLLRQLPQNLQQLQQLTPQQRAELSRQLSQCAGGAAGVCGAAGANVRVAGEGEPRDGKGVGTGGPGGGGDTAPLALSDQRSDAGRGKDQGLSGASLKQAALGDKLRTTVGMHEVDPNLTTAPSSAGAVATPAQGGDAVWVNRLTPAERAALKKFFQ